MNKKVFKNCVIVKVPYQNQIDLEIYSENNIDITQTVLVKFNIFNGLETIYIFTEQNFSNIDKTDNMYYQSTIELGNLEISPKKIKDTFVQEVVKLDNKYFINALLLVKPINLEDFYILERIPFDVEEDIKMQLKLLKQF